MHVNTQTKNMGILLGVVASLIWGSWPVFSKVAATQSLTPEDITALRFSIAGITLLPVLIHRSIKLRLIFTKGMILAIGAGAPYVFLATYGINLSSSSHFGVIAPSSMLVFSSIGSIFLFKEKITAIHTIGIVSIISGVISIGILSFNSINPDIVLGDIMFVGCGALWASFTLLCKYWQLNSWIATSMVSVVSGVICLPFAINVIHHTPVNLLLFHGVYQGILVAILALYCYSKSVAILGAARGAIFASLVPPISLGLSYLIVGESMSLNEITGSLFIVFGMLLALGVIKFNRFNRIVKQKNSGY